VLSSSRAATGEPALQAEAWLAWLLAASIAVFLTSNPFYLATACLVGLVVYESLPRGRRRRAYGLVVKIGLFFALLSIPFNVLTGSSGAITGGT
jgi:energy-coupling factor transporter transmembrane protein EcfT